MSLGIRRLVIAIVRAVITLVFVGVAPAVIRADEFRVGAKVFWKPDAVAKVGNTKTDVQKIPFPATIGDMNGEWVWLERAWVRKGEVMTAQQALAYYDDYVRRFPTVARGWRCRGAVLDEMGETDRAINDYTQSIRIDSHDVSSFNNRGSARVDKEEFDDAIKDFTEAIRLAPQFAGFYVNRGLAWKKKGEIANAIADFDSAIGLDPQDPFAFYNRGLAFKKKGENVAALRDLSEAIRLNQKYYLAYRARGDIWKSNDAIDKAIADYTIVIKLHPQPADSYIARGDAWIAKNELEKAVDDFTEAIKLDSTKATAYIARGGAWEEKGDFGQALRDYNEAGRISSKHPGTFRKIAWIRATCPDDRFRDGAEAVTFAMRAFELEEDQTPSTLSTLAAAYAQAGNFPEAIKWQEKSLKLTPQHERQPATDRIDLYRQGKPYRTASRSSRR